MKPLRILAGCLICASIALAQGAPEEHLPPGVVILKLEWWKESFFSSHSGPPDAPPRTSEEIQSPTPTPQPFPPPSRPGRSTPSTSRSHHYSMKFRNGGAKTIKAVAWEYIFLDPNSKKEMGRHRFSSYQKVSPNKSATLQAKSASPPSHVASIEGLGKDERSPFLEKAVIKCVLYTDGTRWQHLAAKATECEDLQQGEKRETRPRTR
jgi:hypothetical protein